MPFESAPLIPSYLNTLKHCCLDTIKDKNGEISDKKTNSFDSSGDHFMKIILALVSATLLFTSSTAHATKLLLEAGVHAGGDKIENISFVGSGSNTLHAGGMISLSAGYAFETSKNWELRTTWGIKTDRLNEANNKIEFTRYPFSMVLFKRIKVLSMGIGATYHVNPKFHSQGSLGNGIITFDYGKGLMAEIDLNFTEDSYLGVQATAINYYTGTQSVNGNSVGIVIGTRF